MVMKNRTARFIVFAAIALLALLATGCENPANSSSDSVSGDTADADPHTLVLPAGTVQGWDSQAAGTDWYIKYYGNGESSSTSTISDTGLGVFSLQSNQFPGQTLTRNEISSRLAEKSGVLTFRWPWQLADTSAGSLVELSPNNETKALRVSTLRRSDSVVSATYDLVRRSPDTNTRIEWWYVESDSTANGVYDFNNTYYRFVDDVQLSAGWNTIVLTRRTPSTNGSDPSNQWDAAGGSEPAGVSWYFYSSVNTGNWYD
jgi:hypothetical protein